MWYVAIAVVVDDGGSCTIVAAVGGCVAALCVWESDLDLKSGVALKIVM